MAIHWLRHRQGFKIAPLLLMIVFTIACGSAAPADPVVVEKEVVKEVPKEVIVGRAAAYS